MRLELINEVQHTFKTRENALVEFLDYQVSVTQLMWMRTRKIVKVWALPVCRLLGVRVGVAKSFGKFIAISKTN